MKALLLSNRFKSFYWRAGCMLAMVTINFITENLTSFGLSNEMVVFLGLVLAECTKALSNFSQGKSA